MREEKRQERHEAITDAAYALLAEKGYEGTSMLSIAKAANASNETLYRWYGDKAGLFAAMIADNVETTRGALVQAISARSDPMAALKLVSPLLLAMLLGERAVLLNRVAASDASGRLGEALAIGGRDVVRPLLMQLVSGMAERSGAEPGQLADLFLSLLVGDQQIRRVIGAMPVPDAEAIEARCRFAMQAFERVIARS